MDRIDKENIENIFPLTPMQEGMLFHYLANPDGDTYVEQLCLLLHGSIERNIFKKAWECVVATNEMLRTVFRWEKMKNPVQLVLKHNEPDIRFVSNETDKLNEKFFRGSVPRRGRPLNHTLANQKVRKGDRLEKFDLQEAPFRVVLCKLAEDSYEMIISNHHILYDGWSNGIILREFFHAYAALSAGEMYAKPQKTGFKEYIRWLHDQDQTRQKHFWQDYLAGLAAPTVLPIKRPQGKAAPSTGSFKTQLSKSSSLELEHFARASKITPAAMFYCAWGILLQKYNNSADVVFGTTTAGRPAKIKGIEEMVGLFINTPPIRVQVFPGETAAAVLNRIDADMKRREEYEAAPLVQIKEYSPISGSGELFDSIMVIENYPMPTGPVHPQAGLVMTGCDMIERTNYDLTIAVMLPETGIQLNFIYNTLVLEEEDVARLCGHFVNILQEIKENPARQIGEIEMLSAAEKQQIVVDFNRREEEYAADKTIRRLFLEQVERTPDSTAAIGERLEGRRSRETLTFRQLAEEANRVALYLSGKGLHKNDLAGIMVDRGLEMITGILGILLSGAGYVPLNPRAPAIHSKYIMDECRVAVLLTAHEITEIVSSGKERPKFDACTYIEDITGGEEEAQAAKEQRETLANTNAPAAGIAYIIFTSGSTGRPKGVPIMHSNFCALLHWGYRNIKLNTADRVVQNLSYYFDWSVWEIFIAVASGAGLVLVKKETMQDAEAYIDFMNMHGITALHITPTQFQPLTHTGRELTSLRHLAIGAEKLTFDLVQRAFGMVKETCRVYNMYGPTEATIMAAVLEIERDNDEFYTKLSSIPIGPPIANNDFYILDRHFNVTPMYAVGELYIAGAGVAHGYLNNPELTAEKFAFNNKSYKTYKTYNTYKTYRTGDLARWLADGTVEYMGRVDQQVKIRGFRIEPGEIENRLLEHENIKAAVVIVKQYKNGENYLCAYIVTTPQAATSLKLREYLAQTLPDYMIPQYFVEVGQIPLNANGKVDIKALPEPDITARTGEFTAPGDEIEEKLAHIWQEVLSLAAPAGIDDHFFESGGHSLKASRLLAVIHKEFNVEIPLGEIFNIPTIRGLAGYIKQEKRSKYEALKQAEKKEYYPLSPAQQRLYLLQQMGDEIPVYNMPGIFRVTGRVDKERFAQVFTKLIARHESLRTSFQVIDGQPVQVIHDPQDIVFHLENGAAGQDEQAAIAGFVRSFDLAKAPLLRAGLLETAEQQYILMVDMHHIISDGTSLTVSIKDFISLCKGEEPAALPFQYRDYSIRLSARQALGALSNQQAFWLREFAGEIPILRLPLDFPRPAIQDFSGARLTFALGAEETAALEALARRENITLYMVVLAVFNILLSRLTGREDIVIGTPTAGRKQVDIAQVMGMFVDTLALRNFPHGEKRFNDFVQEVRGRAAAAFENQEYQFEELVKKVGVSYDAGRNPLFDVVFAMQDMEIPRKIELPGLQFELLEYHSGAAKFDMTLSAELRTDELFLSLEYGTALFSRRTIERFIAYFKRIVSGVIENPETRIGLLEILSAEEQRQLLDVFNDVDRDYPADKTIHKLFMEQAARTPAKTALVYEGEEISYSELDKRSAILARRLERQGLGAGDMVGLMVDRSIEMIIGILGILKTGGAYVPLNHKAPLNRNKYIMDECKVKLLLTGKEIGEQTGQKLAISRLDNTPAGSAAYVIFTSGSTGKPKGVIVTHANFCPLMYWGYDILGLGSDDRTLQNLSYYFDWSVWEIFITLTTGAALYIVAGEVLLNPEVCIDFIIANDITILHATPTQFQYIAAEEKRLPGLKYLFIGAEKLSYDLMERSFAAVSEGCRVFNMYGPTEATIIAAALEIDRQGYKEFKNLSSIPIGKPSANLRLLVLDKSLQLCPVGTTGELYIQGDGVATGYLNNPELTAERFASGGQGTFLKNRPLHPQKTFEKSYVGHLSPLTTPHSPFTTHLYKTGDLARWLTDGNIEFLGRLDFQVKIRGFRIEPGEIENRLREHENVKEAVVLAVDAAGGEKYLCAYIVGSNEKAVEAALLRDHLSRLLPDYMIPAHFIFIDRIPLNANGKVDRGKLPKPDANIDEKRDIVQPTNELERKLLVIWSEVLGIEEKNIGIDDNFFKIGGHSLKAISMMGRMHKELDVKVELLEIINTPTIRQIASLIESIGWVKEQEIEEDSPQPGDGKKHVKEVII